MTVTMLRGKRVVEAAVAIAVAIAALVLLLTSIVILTTNLDMPITSIETDRDLGYIVGEEWRRRVR